MLPGYCKFAWSAHTNRFIYKHCSLPVPLPEQCIIDSNALHKTSLQKSHKNVSNRTMVKSCAAIIFTKGRGSGDGFRRVSCCKDKTVAIITEMSDATPPPPPPPTLGGCFGIFLLECKPFWGANREGKLKLLFSCQRFNGDWLTWCSVTWLEQKSTIQKGYTMEPHTHEMYSAHSSDHYK